MSEPQIELSSTATTAPSGPGSTGSSRVSTAISPGPVTTTLRMDGDARVLDTFPQVCAELRMRNPHAGLPFTAEEFSDAQIVEALRDVSVPTLLLSCVHMTDDPAVRESILTGPVRPQGLFLNEV